METTAMILNYLINSETTIQSPLHPAGVGVQAALPLHIQAAFPQTAQACHLYCPFFFFCVQHSFPPPRSSFQIFPDFYSRTGGAGLG